MENLPRKEKLEKWQYTSRWNKEMGTWKWKSCRIPDIVLMLEERQNYSLVRMGKMRTNYEMRMKFVSFIFIKIHRNIFCQQTLKCSRVTGVYLIKNIFFNLLELSAINRKRISGWIYSYATKYYFSCNLWNAMF